MPKIFTLPRHFKFQNIVFFIYSVPEAAKQLVEQVMRKRMVQHVMRKRIIQQKMTKQMVHEGVTKRIVQQRWTKQMVRYTIDIISNSIWAKLKLDHISDY